MDRWPPCLFLFLAACVAAGPLPPEEPESAGQVGTAFATPKMSDHRRLQRIAMSLVGRRPTAEELKRVQSDPGGLRFVVNQYLTSPAFGRTVRDMHNEWWLYETSSASVPVNLLGNPALTLRELPQQPLRLIEDIVMNDRPYSEIVQADYTMANGLVAAAWEGISDPAIAPSSEEWQRTEWTDGRVSAGLLSDSWTFLVYRSPIGNHNRGRAAAIAKNLLCVDFLTGIGVPDRDLDLGDAEAVENSLREDPACSGCHDTLDPLAAYLVMSPYPVVAEEEWPLGMYDPFYEGVWEEIGSPPPAYFGEPGEGLNHLGDSIAADPRFARCTVRKVVSYLEQRPLEDVEESRIDELTAHFEENSLRMRDLVREIVHSDAFVDLSPEGPGALVVRPEQIGPLFADLTGYTWETESYTECCGNRNGSEPYGYVPDATRDAVVGYKLLLGGVDSPAVTSPTHTVNTTSLAVIRVLAQRAAAETMARRREGLVAGLDWRNLEDEDRAREQFVELHSVLYAESLAPDDPEIEATMELWTTLIRQSRDATAAWEHTLAAMLQDPRLVMY